MSAAAAKILQRAAADGDLVVNELFSSIQGEGPSAGQAAVFLRLGSCNLDCGSGQGARWRCDTPHTWQWSNPAFDPSKELFTASVDVIAEYVKQRKARRVVITGGEPLLQQQALVPLVTDLCEAGHLVEFETNGTIAPVSDLVAGTAQFNVSPKLSSSGVRRSKRLASAPLRAFAETGKAIFKFVITDPAADVPEVEEIVSAYGLDPVWLLPEGTEGHAVLDGMLTLTEIAVPRGWSVSPRLHVLLWGDHRGR